MAREISRRDLPEPIDVEVVDTADMVYEEPPLPYPDDNESGGELMAAGWPIGEGIGRLTRLLERYPVYVDHGDLPLAIELLKKADEIVKNLPTQEYPAPREPLTDDEAIALAEELHRRLSGA